MMEATSTSETSVNFYQATRRNNPEGSHLQIDWMLFCLEDRYPTVQSSDGTASFIL
jgi:hypothetical protein